MKKKISLGLLLSFFVLGVGLFATRTCVSQTLEFRWNQVGYLPQEKLDLLVLSPQNLPSSGWSLQGSTQSYPLQSLLAGQWNGFQVYRLQHSGLSQTGSFVLKGPFTQSPPPLRVGRAAYEDLRRKSLRFFRYQRCGSSEALPARPLCHQKEAVDLSGAPRAIGGGWHDAGDYLRFSLTASYATLLLLNAHQWNPSLDVDLDQDGWGEALEEALWGLTWLEKLWVPNRGLIYQVGDATDHNHWRLPEDADRNEPAQKFFFSEDGKGANLAGKMAASFALAAELLKNRSGESARRQRYLNLAQQLFQWGLNRPQVQSMTNQFYVENTWRDDMALAALELYKATGQAAYLTRARDWLKSEGNGWVFGYDQMHALAFYKWGLYSPNEATTARSYLKRDLDNYQRLSQGHLFGQALSEFYWGSTVTLMGAALTSRFYEKLGGGTAFQELAHRQKNFLLGRNPWGISMVDSTGQRWARKPHHQIADIKKIPLVGSWGEGPLPDRAWKALGIRLTASDSYSRYQTPEAVYHDDVADYATNEPTLTANATGTLLATILSAP